MLKRYEKFLKDFDEIVKSIFEDQKRYIKCKKGCSICCKQGDYPFSQIEFSYLTQGYINLPANQKIIVQQNIRNLLKDKEEYKGEKRFEHKCPFLINDECIVYDYRGIICRTFGLCYYDDIKGYVRLPGCVHNGLNYSEFYNEKERTLNIQNVPKINLRIDRILNSELANTYNLECGEIRPMLDWLGGKK